MVPTKALALSSRSSALSITSSLCRLKAGVAFPQSVNGVITGVVFDEQRAAVPRATVRVTDELNTTSQSTQTDESGYFVFPGLRPGKYTLSVEKDKFARIEKRDILVLTADRVYPKNLVAFDF